MAVQALWHDATRALAARAPLAAPLASRLIEAPAQREQVGASSTAARKPSASGRGSTQLWHGHDWDNWRDRIFRPTCEASGLPGDRPRDLHGSFASLLIYGRQRARPPRDDVPARLSGRLRGVRLERSSARRRAHPGRARAGRDDPASAARSAADRGARTYPVPSRERRLMCPYPGSSRFGSLAGGLGRALHRTRTGDPFLTIEGQESNGSKSWPLLGPNAGIRGLLLNSLGRP
jgi:hypothetical protein